MSDQRRVGVLFGGRSSEHDVSLASARNVMDALRQAGHEVVPMGITREGRWLLDGDPLRQLTDGAQTNGAQVNDAQANGAHSVESTGDSFALLPHASPDGAPDASVPVDVIFPVLHGPMGEDGTVQGLLELANLPYVGCGVLASALAMDKATAKRLFAAEGLPQTPHRTVQRRDWRAKRARVLDELEAALPYPLFVKPANMGSSVGVSRAADRGALEMAMDVAAGFDRKIVIEQAVANAREIEVAVLETPEGEVLASVPGEIVPPSDDFYSYEAKYENDASTLLIPAVINKLTSERVRELAVRAFRAVEGEGLARVDFLLDGGSGALYLNEINTLPGFTRISMFPKLWAASGIDYPELVDRLVELAVARHAERQENRTDR